MIKTITLAVISLISLSSFVPASYAQEYESPDQYYRPMTSRELNYRLRPNMERHDDMFASGGSAFNKGCPQEINIGGIGSGTRIFGNVDIDINVDRDLIVNCSR